MDYNSSHVIVTLKTTEVEKINNFTSNNFLPIAHTHEMSEFGLF